MVNGMKRRSKQQLIILRSVKHSNNLMVTKIVSLAVPIQERNTVQQVYYELIDKKDAEKLRFDLKDTCNQALTKLLKATGIRILECIVVTYDEKSIEAMHLNMLINDAPKIASYFAIKKWIIQDKDSKLYVDRNFRIISLTSCS